MTKSYSPKHYFWNFLLTINISRRIDFQVRKIRQWVNCAERDNQFVTHYAGFNSSIHKEIIMIVLTIDHFRSFERLTPKVWIDPKTKAHKKELLKCRFGKCSNYLAIRSGCTKWNTFGTSRRITENWKKMNQRRSRRERRERWKTTQARLPTYIRFTKWGNDNDLL